MIVKMTEKEKKCNDYCQKHKKSWEASIIASDAYMAGYRQAREDCKKRLQELTDIIDFVCVVGPGVLADIGEDETEVEFKNGSHMLGTKTTN